MSDIEDGRRLRDEGMRKADAHVHPAWRAVASAALLELARTGRVFSAEDVTAIAGIPAQPNVIGSLFSTYARRGVIVEYGYVQATRASRHASRTLTWRGTAKAGSYLPPEPVQLKDQQPAGQQSIFTPGWHCPNCDHEIAKEFVTVWDIAPNYGQAFCQKCGKKVTVQLR